MKKSLHFSIVRNVISILIVVALCVWYYYYTGRTFVWFFVPISLMPLVITLYEYWSQQSEANPKPFEVDKKIDSKSRDDREKK